MGNRRDFLIGSLGLLAMPPLASVRARAQAQKTAANAEELWRLFAEPPATYSPLPLWWWSGEPLERKRLRWQMERLREGGIFQVTIINLAPASPWAYSVPDSPRFFSDEWWKMFRAVCEDARELGMKIWFYDQIGFSSANIHGDLMRQHPQFKARMLRAIEGKGSVDCPEGSEPIAAFVLGADGKSAPAPLKGGRAGSGGPQTVRLFYAARAGFDYLSPAASRALIDRIHGEFERRAGEFFGSVIAGSFQDELGRMPTWSETFAEEFRRRKGYDLLAHMSALWEGDSGDAEGIRADYQQVRAALAEEAFSRPLFEWHQQRGLQLGYDQSGPARLGDPAGATNLYADYPRTGRWATAPGSDHGGETKIHSSFAHLYERPRVWMESFHSSGWGGTLEETFDWLLLKIRAGATLYDPHAVYYSTWGGWWEWAPPSTCWRQPYWRHQPVFSKAVSRLCAVLSQGKHVADVGILYPTATVQANIVGDQPNKTARKTSDIYHALVGTMDWVRVNVAPGVLDRNRRDFDVLDDDSIARARIADGALAISGESYRVVILPGCTVMESQTAAALCRFVNAGGILIAVGELPRQVAGRKADVKPLAALTRLFAEGKARRVEKAEDVPGLLRDLPRRVEAPVATLLRRAGDTTVLFVPAAYPGATHYAGQRMHFRHDFDANRYQRDMRIRVRDVRSAPEVWDPVTGERRTLEAKVGPEGVEVTIPFDGGPAALLVWGNPPAASPARASGNRAGVLQELSGAWDIRLEPTLDNRYGDFAKPNGAPIPVQTWAFRHRVEKPGEDGLGLGWVNPAAATADWQEANATFGTYGWWKGPAPVGQLPAPLPALGSGADPLAADGWQPAVYSLSRGIFKDPVHAQRFGVRGHIPEEFLHFGRMRPGDGVQCRTSVWLPEAKRLHVVLSAPAAKQVWVDGKLAGEAASGDQLFVPLNLSAGRRLIEFRLAVKEARELRAWWALVNDAEKFARPEWIAAGDTPSPDSWLRFTGSWPLPPGVTKAEIQFGIQGGQVCGLRVNGREAGWVDHRARFLPLDVTRLVREGDNEITVEVLDPGRGRAAVLVDGRAESRGAIHSLISGAPWRVRRDNRAAAPVRLAGRADRPDSSTLWRRAHPLPQASWLERTPADGTVVPIAPDALGGERVEWLRWVLPPGAKSMRLPAAGQARVFVNGREAPLENGRVSLPEPGSLRRTCVVRVSPGRGRTGGALLDGPVTYEMGTGRMTAGDWSQQGLETYSGGIWYARRVTLDKPPAGVVELDLGRVRGTVEVHINDRNAGTRICSPYRVEVTSLLKAGENLFEILVLNTLGPYLKGHSATHFVFPGQEVSGLFGPVRLIGKA